MDHRDEGGGGLIEINNIYPCPRIVGPTEPMEGLTAEEKRMCSQLAEMGFPLSRLVTAVR